MFMSEQDFLGESSAAPEPFPDLSDFEYLDADFPFGELENGNVWNSFFAGDHSANLSFLPRCPSPTIPVGPALTPLSGFPLSEWSLNVEPEQRHNTLDVPRVIASHSPPPQPAMRISPPSFVAPHFPMILPLPTFSPQHPEQHRPFRHKVQLPKSPAGRSGAIPNRSQKRGQIVGVSINESEFVQVTKGESHLMLNPATLTIQVGSFSVKNDSHLIGDASALGIRVSSSQPSEMLVNDTPKHENKKMALKLNYSDISCRVGQERTQKGTNTRFVVTVTIG
ncbi:hypothetical protein BLNAU_1536 [Blattamonas nauphoetae]|uniref:Uncharacterized protein n=1 Tax=Blattamonas nauphoetae TaxID=2049346 RepID=A0ABQ9YIB4_9EUKA|nr:hypothetical protein BLNAU_1536 [Blattamonas nauphoetae]